MASSAGAATLPIPSGAALGQDRDEPIEDRGAPGEMLAPPRSHSDATSHQTDLCQALHDWHAALARDDLEAQIAARLLVDIPVAGGLDERIEEVTPPAGRESGPVLPLLRQANRLTRELGHLAACQLATARQLERNLAGRIAPPTPAPTQPSRGRPRAVIRPDLSTLLVLLALTAYGSFLLGATISGPKPLPLSFPLPHDAPAPQRPTPSAAPSAAPSDHIPAVLEPRTTAAPPSVPVPS